MTTLVVLALIGLAAQLVDGSLGMAYGVTSTTLLLAMGLSPVMASATVHLAELGTSLASGIAHHRFGNVDWKVAGWLALPGALGALLGAWALSSLPAELAKPWVALFLLILGCYVIFRFLRTAPGAGSRRAPRLPWLAPLGLMAGFLDSAGGGGWGPVATTTLLSRGRLEPRRVVGSVDTSEFLVALAASLGFLWFLGSSGIDLAWVLALLAGGVIAAPLAAWLVQKLPGRILATAAGGIIIITNLRTLMPYMNGVISSWIYVGLIPLLLAAVLVAWRREFSQSSVSHNPEELQVNANK